MYTAFSGRAKDAIKKGMAALGRTTTKWEVPACRSTRTPGRTYEAIIQVSSQSGKGGVAYVMDTDPRGRPAAATADRGLQTGAGDHARNEQDRDRLEDQMRDVFEEIYLPEDAGLRLMTSEVSTGKGRTVVTAQLLVDGQHRTVTGEGDGPIGALVAAR